MAIQLSQSDISASPSKLSLMEATLPTTSPTEKVPEQSVAPEEQSPTKETSDGTLHPPATLSPSTGQSVFLNFLIELTMNQRMLSLVENWRKCDAMLWLINELIRNSCATR
jgi:hypothetical protein